jgi:hypothetical protein
VRRRAAGAWRCARVCLCAGLASLTARCGARSLEISTVERNIHVDAKSEEERKAWLGLLGISGVKLRTPNPNSLEADGFPGIPREYARQGYLQKRGEWNPGFKRRFFRTLESASGSKILAYYDSMVSVKPNGIIPLKGARFRDSDEDEAELSDLMILTDKRIFTIRAQSAEEKKSWLDTLGILLDGSYVKFFIPPRLNTHYDTLQISAESTAEEVSHAFRNVSKALHPDRNPSAEAKVEYQKVSAAYDILSEDDSRTRYDEEILAHPYLDPATKAQILSRRDKEKAAREEKALRDAIFAAKGGVGGADDGEGGGRPKSKSQVARDFFNDDRNKCESCFQNVRAIFCVFCNQGLCLRCSEEIHKADETKRHLRVVYAKRDQFWVNVRTPGTKDHKAAADLGPEDRDLLLRRILEHEGKAEELRKLEERLAEQKKAREAKAAADAAAAAAAAPPAAASAAPQGKAPQPSPKAIMGPAAAAAAAAAAPAAKVAQIEHVPEHGGALVPVSKEAVEAARKAKEEDEKERKTAPATAAATAAAAAVAGGAAAGAPPLQNSPSEPILPAHVASRAAPSKEEERLLDNILLLEEGTEMTKVPRFGEAKKTTVKLMKTSLGAYFVRWSSQTKAAGECTIMLAEAQLLPGQQTEIFKKKKAQLGHQQNLSFSLVSKDRHLDVVCANEKDFERWFSTLSALMKAGAGAAGAAR